VGRVHENSDSSNRGHEEKHPELQPIHHHRYELPILSNLNIFVFIPKIFLSPEAYKATQAVEFIAEHLRNEDEYVQIREDWKFVAMVVDRLQLWVFFLVTTIGTIGILMDAPHIFEFVDQDKMINIYRGK
jgi:hypothetical protein